VTRVARQLSIVAACPDGTGLKGIRRAMEGVFGVGPDVEKHSRAGGAYACATGVQVPDGLGARAARGRTRGELPGARI